MQQQSRKTLALTATTIGFDGTHLAPA